MRKVWKWKEGARGLNNVDPGEAGRYLSALAKRNGGKIDAEVLLNDTKRNPQSPFRQVMEWDDAEAARQYRLTQARYILRCLTCEIVVQDKVIETRAYAVVGTHDSEPAYRPIEVVMRDPELRTVHMAAARKEFEEYRTRWNHLSELSRLFQIGADVFAV